MRIFVVFGKVINYISVKKVLKKFVSLIHFLTSNFLKTFFTEIIDY